jgi:hypothetical protein
MAEDRGPAVSDRAQQLLDELRQLVRQQGQAHQAAVVEAQRLRAVIDHAATQLAEMLAGQRASRAALQALIDEVRPAIGMEDAGAP